MIVVSDTTPLLTLFKIGQIDLLNKLYNSVHIPFAVFEELTRNTEYPEEAEYFRNCPFLEIHSDFSADRVSLLQRATGLDLGESEAIILADERQPSFLLIDESKGRACVARELVNRIQNRRKEQGYAITDKIEVILFSESDVLKQAVVENEFYIKGETQATKIVWASSADGLEANEADGENFYFTTKKA